jgi:hypothetical protein
MHEAAAVELLYMRDRGSDAEQWACKLLFVEPAIETRTFRRGEQYRSIHGSTSLSV